MYQNKLPKLYQNKMPLTTLKLNGLGGEIFTGYYYAVLRERNMSQLVNYFQTYENKAKNLEILDEKIINDFNLRVEKTLYKFEDFTSNYYDLTDIYYIFERFGNWGATLVRSSWNLREVSNFASPFAILKSFNYRTPIGNTHFLHNYLIKKNLKKFYSTPINGNFLDIPVFYGLPENIIPYLRYSQIMFAKIQSIKNVYPIMEFNRNPTIKSELNYLEISYFILFMNYC